MTVTQKRLVILISGSGSNLQAFIDQCANGALNAEIAAVISNKPDAFGLKRAADAGIATAVVDHRQYPDRESFDADLAATINEYRPDLVILAGFMRILTPGFVRRFHGRLLNIHPSLLPKYPGLDTHRRAIDAGDAHGGATVHFVTEELDGGPAIVQASVPISADDNHETLAARVLKEEHIIYPLAAGWFIDGRLKLHDDGAYLDKKKIPVGGHDRKAIH